MKRILILIAVTFCFVASSCRKNEETNNESLKTKTYSSLSEKEQLTLNSGLVKRLKEDPDFKNYDRSFEGVMVAYGTRDRSKVKKLPPNKPKQANQRLAYYKESGFQNPVELMRNEVNLITSVARVFKKFPELKEMDRNNRKLVIKEAQNGLRKSAKLKVKNHMWNTVVVPKFKK